jgi:hypothetical protein
MEGKPAGTGEGKVEGTLKGNAESTAESTVEVEVGHGLGLLCLRLESNGEVREQIAPERLDWRVRMNRGSQGA